MNKSPFAFKADKDKPRIYDANNLIYPFHPFTKRGERGLLDLWAIKLDAQLLSPEDIKTYDKIDNLYLWFDETTMNYKGAAHYFDILYRYEKIIGKIYTLDKLPAEVRLDIIFQNMKFLLPNMSADLMRMVMGTQPHTMDTYPKADLFIGDEFSKCYFKKEQVYQEVGFSCKELYNLHHTLLPWLAQRYGDDTTTKITLGIGVRDIIFDKKIDKLKRLVDEIKKHNERENDITFSYAVPLVSQGQKEKELSREILDYVFEMDINHIRIDRFAYVGKNDNKHYTVPGSDYLIRPYHYYSSNPGTLDYYERTR